MKYYFIILFTLLILGCTNNTQDTNNLIINNQTHLYLQNNTKTITLQKEQSNELIIKQLVDGITKQIINNATYNITVIGLQNDIINDITELMTNNKNGSYTLKIPTLKTGEYLIRINWEYNNITSTTIHSISIR